MIEENEEDCGCSAQSNKEMNELEFENVKKNMESTRDSLNKMFDTIQNMNLDFSRFDNLEKEIKKTSNFMQSGEFAKTITDALKGANIDPDKLAALQPNKMAAKTEAREPIGWVYVDENGEQKFSIDKPENITSMPVYGD